MINLLLHLVNFFVLLGIGYYFFKRYAEHALHQQIAFEKLSHDALERQREELIKQKKQAELHERRQHVEFQDLTGKIAQWRSDVAKKEFEREEQQKVIEHFVQQRRLRQLHDQEQIALYTKAVPLAVKEAEEELKKIFMLDARVQQAYMRSIVQYMQTFDTESSS